MIVLMLYSFFFLNDTAPPEIYTLPLHDALPISDIFHHLTDTAPPFNRADTLLSGPVSSGSTTARRLEAYVRAVRRIELRLGILKGPDWGVVRSEEHTSELQSRLHLVCRLLLEKK